jgi:DNA-binding PadR family transcriptional regulator
MEEEKVNVLKAISLATSLEGRPVDRTDIVECASDYHMPLSNGLGIRPVLKDLRREGLIRLSFEEPSGYYLTAEGREALLEERRIRGKIPVFQREEVHYGIR